ncbi:MAG TPA: 50S ribosomal protein L18 [Actinomycetota bacterium]|nr:50S ribosomal protein L18 [Actinomycetota bacterium]
MVRAAEKREARVRRHRRVRRRITGDAARPRLAVYRSNRHVYAQLIDDLEGRTLAAASSRETDAAGDGDKKAAARRVGGLIARRAREAGIERAVFDRGGRLYHGRVREVAEAAREEGLQL